MSESTQSISSEFIELAADIISAYVSNNVISVAELPALISNVHAALNGLAHAASTSTAVAVERPTPAQIRKSITPDTLISFIDGKPYKMLKRHLTGHGLDPQSYRQRYGLSADYPMVAASYAAQRSELAKSIGLGRTNAQDRSEHSRGHREAA
ncbi:MucR family transcriptional regulator [Methylobacterium planeticum]|uniref:MucR family transcriptional regulator n=1 Tax=Methylobacterium planeticum TaxID=2615211 RepID=A0A6N6MDV7_9HYPH|nr:MucR family transcriptional regulator [Methylobacterium planeticum]KAB1067896.1 MucR family transcriptional regulator [Methylobacterium planeticum]